MEYMPAVREGKIVIASDRFDMIRPLSLHQGGVEMFSIDVIKDLKKYRTSDLTSMMTCCVMFLESLLGIGLLTVGLLIKCECLEEDFLIRVKKITI